MQAFDSIAKKLALPVIVLFEIGWVVFIGGFCLQLHLAILRSEELERDPFINAIDSPRSPLFFPHYFTLVGGQFVALLILLQAALPSGIASSIVGVLSTILNIIYFVSVGYLITFNVFEVPSLERRRTRELQLQSTGLSPSDLGNVERQLHAARCVLAGTIIMAISWGLIQLLFFFYEPKNSQLRRSLWHVIREFGRPITSASQLKATLGEWLRLCTIPVLILSAIGWCVCVAGFHKTFESNNTTSQNYPFGIWATFFIAPLLYLTALLHAGCSGDASTMSGIFAAILNTFFILNVPVYTVVAVSLVKYRRSLRLTLSRFTVREPDPEEIHNENLVLGGSIVCLFFWTFIHVFWHFYRLKGSGENSQRVGLQSESSDGQSQTISHAQQSEYDSSVIPKQPPPYTEHLEAEMQPVIN